MHLDTSAHGAGSSAPENGDAQSRGNGLGVWDQGKAGASDSDCHADAAQGVRNTIQAGRLGEPGNLQCCEIRLSPQDLADIDAGRRGVALPEPLAEKLVQILLAAAAGKRITTRREPLLAVAATAGPNWPKPYVPLPEGAQIRSLAAVRAGRDHKRLLTLQAEFARRGFALDPLTEKKLMVQRWGLWAVLDGLDAAQAFLRRVEGAT